MAIIGFEFVDKLYNWQLEYTHFSPFNLLVGLSGVGKTRALKALELVCGVGLGKPDAIANGCQWRLDIEYGNQQFHWSAETSEVYETGPKRNLDDKKKISKEPQFLSEKIEVNGKPIVNRSGDEFVFKNLPIPKLKNTESAISLFSEDESIAPLHQALERVLFFDDSSTRGWVIFDISEFNRSRKHYKSIDELRHATDIPLFLKMYILQEDLPQEFERIKADYIDIFDTVVDIKIGRVQEFDPDFKNIVFLHKRIINDGYPFLEKEWLVMVIKEEGVKDWIISSKLSSGMLRTLIHLFEVYLAAPGTVIVVDEIENSLGLNCLPQLIDHFLRRANEVQFILTSHHPYVINNISMDRWKVVTRKGSTVRILDKNDIRALNTKSIQDRFTILMNLEEYEEGIQ